MKNREVKNMMKHTDTTYENNRQGTYEITMKIAVPSNLELDKVTSQIRILKNVLKINRI